MAETAAVAIARLEATLEGIKRQIDHQDRNAQQLVRLFEERISVRFDAVEQRLGRIEQAQEHDTDRLNSLEKFNARLIGVALGSAALGAGVVAAIERALGG